jgi:DNA-binding MarR family transcriptional regulator
MEDINEDIIILFFEVMRLSNQYAHSMSDDNSNHMVGQYRCLQVLYMDGDMTQRELADKLHIRATSLSETIVRLESKGFIKRNLSTKDKRTFVVSLTKEGRKAITNNMQHRESLYNEMLITLTDDEKTQFKTILQKIKTHYLDLKNNS